MPFGVPLVPLVYISVATSSGLIVSKTSCWPDKWKTTVLLTITSVYASWLPENWTFNFHDLPTGLQA